MKSKALVLCSQRRFFSLYNFFICVRKGGEATLIKDIKQRYVREVIKYQAQKKDTTEEKNEKSKKEKHLVRLGKCNGGVQIKCSPSLIYLLSLKCGYVESIWLNVSKNASCNSLITLQDIIRRIPWDSYISPDHLEDIPLKITSRKSKLFDVADIGRAVRGKLNEFVRSYRGGSNITGERYPSPDACLLTPLLEDPPPDEQKYETNVENQKERTKKNTWNLLAVHIENNLCNVDIKFTGKLSPRFYQYCHVDDQLANVANYNKCDELNFNSLFNKDLNIGDDQIKSIVKDNVPFWSIFEEKKKIQLSDENTPSGEESHHYYKYNYFGYSRKRDSSDHLTSAKEVAPRGEKCHINSYPNENNHSPNVSEPSNEKELVSGFEIALSAGKKYAHEETYTDEYTHDKVTRNIEKGKRENQNNCTETSRTSALGISHTDNERVLNYLRDMEIKRMNHHNNNFFLSDDCYDTASCIYSLALQKCLKNQKHVKLIWDPFCSNGNIIFELLFYFLRIPIYSDHQILPFMNLKIYDQEEFLRIYRYVLDNTADAQNHQVQLLGTDSRSIMIAQCKKNLVRCALYYKNIFEKVQKNKKCAYRGSSTVGADPSPSSCGSYLSRDSFLDGALGDHVMSEHDGEQEEEMDVTGESCAAPFDEMEERSYLRDMDALRRLQETPRGGLPRSGIQTEIVPLEEASSKVPTETTATTTTRGAVESVITAPDLHTMSVSTAEDLKYNLDFPLDISFHKAHFFNVAPFVKDAIIITKIPHFTFVKELGVNKKTFTLYEQFEQMLSSRSDWKGVYVLIRNEVFLKKSKLEWNKMLHLRDSKGRHLTLLSWTGRKKNLYSFATEDDKLRELERFSESLTFEA
ncbi:conserved Plasmodium protein, unknown function [Plasmodium knowlesi strain H]|uniref:Methyltransferase n=3 Tax=Plasmodium knowlesi TaxID=5850 RepID=A0A5K1UL43_PLAKH|nr:conserved protein, unknown function [Plasmodium knowlesi strain H]OTN63797.1 Uncharacterized protein PKNOH_S140263400 [Plasmodium knowlesi]CAA9991049.1 conserved protein, unknown function [Plasmodium knowlesi strain H]SBO20665.1 conserved Plasmodium protein, unknown function [Plasmodium knowlesi strain H]SBO21091.1 conserved Plasmodium protein, unknown function [Plasmodium knowlesi strain H]VVS80523.1 conserved protein, unknown function [Plasmodium knowlesi strain H]|eukprot:XP_002262331.1 hypothetical protein, conserved in Plasmodium species [Plasmodium knowlesi strain H]